MELKIAEIIAFVKDEFNKIRSNRPTTRLVEYIKVDYMGSEMPIVHVASLSINPPRDILVTPWDRSAIPAITKGIEAANLGLGISADSNGIRLTMPDLTTERKNELVKLVKGIAEENRIKMRGARDKIMKQVNSLSDEDEKFRSKDKIQKIVDKFNSEIDQLVGSKAQDLSL